MPQPHNSAGLATVPRGPGWKFVAFVGFLAALGAVTTDMYLPSLPQVANDLQTSKALAQATITGVLLGGAVGQLVMGALSDRFGRRRPAMVGIAIHVAASVAAAFAPNIATLLTLRIIQGFGNASATVCALAVVRDRFTGAIASVILSRLLLVIGLAPLLAPSVGGLIAHWWSWRAVFFVLAAFGALLILAVLTLLPETLPPERRSAAGLGAALRGYGTLLRDWRFLALALLPGLQLAALIAYVSGSPFVLQEQFGLSDKQFAAFFAFMGLGLIGGAQVNAALVKRARPSKLLRVGLLTTLALAGALVAITTCDVGGVWLLGANLWFLLGASAFIGPNATTMALADHGARAGRGAAVIGSLQAGIAGLVAPLVGVIGADAQAMAIVMCGAIGAATIVAYIGARPYKAAAHLP